MTTSGTATFDLDIGEIIEEAYEQAGLELRSGYDLRTARRSLNLLSLDWANRGYNLWLVEEGTIPLIINTDAYNLPADTIDVIEMVIRTTSGGKNTDITIQRVGLAAYSTIPTKGTTGRPVQAWVDRQLTPRVVLWPVPNASSIYTLVYWRMRRIEDTGGSAANTFDIPPRFLPCLVTGLAYKLAQKRPEAESRLQRLKAEYEELWANAAAEDRERISVTFIPERSWT